MTKTTIGLAASLLLAWSQSPTPAAPLTVMSFNVRYGTADDKDNRWELRKDILFDAVRQQAADIVGLQEALDFQVDQILAAAPRYGVVGVGRDDGRRAGEYAAILFDRERLRIAESGTFWFSDTPTVPASKSWGNNVTRICTWARFIDRDGRAFWVFNVHLDHESQPSREKSAAMLRDRITARSHPDEPMIVTGDFNSGESNQAMETMRRAGFVDSYRVAHPGEKQVGTFTGFTFGAEGGEKIDYVLIRPDATDVLSADIVRTSRNRRYPSDHFPVTAHVRFR